MGQWISHKDQSRKGWRCFYEDGTTPSEPVIQSGCLLRIAEAVEAMEKRERVSRDSEVETVRLRTRRTTTRQLVSKFARSTGADDVKGLTARRIAEVFEAHMKCEPDADPFDLVNWREVLSRSYDGLGPATKRRIRQWMENAF